LDLDKDVQLWNERTYKEVAMIMKQSDVFVFFTRYETFGCVIIEANACGLPVIATDLKVTRELIIDKVNGLLVKSENVEDLSSKISEAINDINQFDRKNISERTIEKFNYETVAEKFVVWYDSVIRKGLTF
jgi:glycosyltransferase involved in cell wall biosynthesis